MYIMNALSRFVVGLAVGFMLGLFWNASTAYAVMDIPIECDPDNYCQDGTVDTETVLDFQWEDDGTACDSLAETYVVFIQDELGNEYPVGSGAYTQGTYATYYSEEFTPQEAIDGGSLDIAYRFGYWKSRYYISDVECTNSALYTAPSFIVVPYVPPDPPTPTPELVFGYDQVGTSTCIDNGSGTVCTYDYGTGIPVNPLLYATMWFTMFTTVLGVIWLILLFV